MLARRVALFALILALVGCSPRCVERDADGAPKVLGPAKQIKEDYEDNVIERTDRLKEQIERSTDGEPVEDEGGWRGPKEWKGPKKWKGPR